MTETTAHKITLKQWLIVISVMLATFMEILDTTIVTVSLPHMMGSLNADSHEITWVLTSYIIASGITMLLTGFLVMRLGRRRLLLINIGGFMIASMLCGIAGSLTQMVIFRLLQGVFGASLVPLSQYILRDTFPIQDLGKAMGIWGMGIMLAPILGPVIGGYITDSMNWRWVFYINVPICLVAYLIAARVIDETEIILKKFDRLGFILLFIGVGTLQFVIDQGNDLDWFSSRKICIFSWIAFVSIAWFLSRSIILGKANIIDCSVFKNRNFTLGSLLLPIFTGTAFGVIMLQPLLLQTLMNYPAKTAGIAFIARGVASGMIMAWIGKNLAKYNPLILTMLGVLLMSIALELLTTLTLNSDMFWDIQISNILQGMGLGLFFIPLTTLSMATVPPELIAEATGIFNFCRSLGTAVGVSCVSTYINHGTQYFWNQLGEKLTPFNLNFQAITYPHVFYLSEKAPFIHVAQELYRQSNMLASLNACKLAGFLVLFTLPFLLLIRKDSVSTPVMH